MMMKKLKIFGGIQTGQYPKIWGVFEVQATFLTVDTRTHQTCRKGFVGGLGVLQHPDKFQAKILKG